MPSFQSRDRVVTSTMLQKDDFHCHLDQCAQCEKHPFDLCPIGAQLLMKAAKEIEEK